MNEVIKEIDKQRKKGTLTVRKLFRLLLGFFAGIGIWILGVFIVLFLCTMCSLYYTLPILDLLSF